MQFAGPPILPATATITAIVKEKGIKDDTTSNPLLRLKKGIYSGAQVLGEAYAGRTGRGVPRASTVAVPLRECLDKGGSEGQFVKVTLPLAKLLGLTSSEEFNEGAVSFQARWLGNERLRTEWLGSQELKTPSSTRSAPFRHNKRRGEVYDAAGITELLKMDRCEGVLQSWLEFYEGDRLYKKAGTDDCPPVKRVVAVSAVNVQTELMYAIRINTVRLKRSTLQTRFELDDEAELIDAVPGRSMSGGIVFEERGGNATSGDGTVPSASLEHCANWKGQIDVQIVRLQGPYNHRTMLNDPQFHEVLRSILNPSQTLCSLSSIAISGDAWQSAKNNRLDAWWNFPGDAVQQLDAARASGKKHLEIQMGKWTYEIDLERMVQRNKSTGAERKIRPPRLAPPGDGEIVSIIITQFRGWPNGGYERQEVVADKCSEEEARGAAFDAVRKDPENCVVEVVFYMSMTGGYWSAKGPARR